LVSDRGVFRPFQYSYTHHAKELTVPMGPLVTRTQNGRLKAMIVQTTTPLWQPDRCHCKPSKGPLDEGKRPTGWRGRRV